MKERKQPRKFFWLKFWILIIGGFFTTNWIYQVYKKPSELIGLFDEGFYKTPWETWKSHGPSFISKSTRVITPDFLAALAQAESQGNAIARTYWRWKFSTNPFEVYTPASSATGMLQITDGTFKSTKKYCIKDGKVLKEGPWYKPNSCWFNFLYSRIIPSHAIEMTSAYLHLQVSRLLRKYKKKVSLKRQQDLATIIHLCGAGRAERFLKRNFQFRKGERCGSHSPRRYLNQLHRLRKTFKKYLKRQ